MKDEGRQGIVEDFLHGLGVCYVVGIQLASVGAEATFCGGDKRDERLGGAAGEFGLCFTDSLTQRAALAENEAVELFKFQPFSGGEACTAQANDVQTANAVVAPSDAEWWEIFADGGAALHQSERTDAHELVHKTVSGNEGAI